MPLPPTPLKLNVFAVMLLVVNEKALPLVAIMSISRSPKTDMLNFVTEKVFLVVSCRPCRIMMLKFALELSELDVATVNPVVCNTAF